MIAHSNLAAAEAAFASELATERHCERVSVGFVEDRFARIIAISHSGGLISEAELLSLLGAAMDEAIEQQTSIRYPSLHGSTPRIALAHQDLQRRQGGGVCSIPLVVDRRIVGAVLFEFQDTRLFDAPQITECEHLISLVGPVLDLMRSNEMSWTTRQAKLLGKTWEALRSPGRSAWRWNISSPILQFKLQSIAPQSPPGYSISSITQLDIAGNVNADRLHGESSGIAAVLDEGLDKLISPAGVLSATGVAFSAGMIWWAARAGGLMASLALSLPT